LDRTKQISYSAVNDDYCDCSDGSDEPGTSACDGMMFYCENKGFTPQLIRSSWVDDGICDCCDGSDEPLRRIICPNICDSLNETIDRQNLEEKDRNYTEALSMKKALILIAERTLKEKSQELRKLYLLMDVIQSSIEALEGNI
jgi:protein kinase C substrate 80K-H